MRPIWQILLFVSLALIHLPALKGQSFAIKEITVQDGLSQNTIYSMCQDERAFMWFGTLEGLNRYDGYEFSTFQNDPLDAKFIRKCIAIVNAHMDDDTFSVDQFSRKAAMSRSYFHRKRKAITNQSAGKFVRTVRLKKALQLLEEGEWNISEIAYKVGFSSLSYFNRCFKKQFGQTPTDHVKESGT